MRLAGLLTAAKVDPALARLATLAKSRSEDQVQITAPPSLRPVLVALAVTARPSGAVLAVTATSREAEDLAEALGCLIDPDSIAVYPSWETLPHERLSPRSDTVGRRLAVLRRLAHPVGEGVGLRVVVAPVRSVLQPQLRGLGDLEPVELVAGAQVEMDAVIGRLSEIAYTRVDLVTKRGEFAVRGGILDVFSPTDEHPLRVEFWGDEIEEIRSFSVADQRTLEAVRRLWAPPCRELLLTPAVRARAAALCTDHPQLAEMLDKLADGIPVEGMESLAPALLAGSPEGADRGSLELLSHCLPRDTTVLLCDPERIRTRAHDLVRTSAEFLAASWAAAAVGGQAPIDLGSASFRTLAQLRATAEDLGHRWWSVSPFGAPEGSSGAGEPALDEGGPRLPGAPAEIVDDAVTVVVNASPAPLYHQDTARVVQDLTRLAGAGWRVVLVFPGPGLAQRASEVLSDAGVGLAVVDRLGEPPREGIVTIATGDLGNGFFDEAGKLAVITGADVSGGRGATTRDMRKLPSRRRNQIDPLELRSGDFVVHESHGIGRYVEMVQRTVNGADREYLVIEYAASKRGHPGDRLFVPTDSLDQLSRYVGGESPTLHKLGGSDWAKSKARARKAVREIAAQLIQLYAARQAAKGHAFGPDTPWQRELEDAFPYQETPDQLAAIEEVKQDMMVPTPMDRLICGDVGYGKTEIGVRAAFKAVADGRQVAVLVPTTLLAQQHYNT
ncbi:MAG: transcription-repair coupling factor, partial [Micromonosporaceae bacterium]|nr:transcription-repair coupling factor [Micromonosporaceae bacterium]